jgi:hypothetical protein
LRNATPAIHNPGFEQTDDFHGGVMRMQLAGAFEKPTVNASASRWRTGQQISNEIRDAGHRPALKFPRRVAIRARQKAARQKSQSGTMRSKNARRSQKIFMA